MPEPRGCLGALLGLLGIGEPSEKQSGDLIFKRKDNFLSPAELSFYHALVAAYGDKAVVCPKVSVNEILFVAGTSDGKYKHHNFGRMHSDFLLCDKQTMSPLCAVELDDSSHASDKAKQADAKKDKAFASAGLPLFRFPAKRAYSIEEIRERLAAAFTTPIASEPPSTTTANQPPICPKCGTQMVLRTASRGANKGGTFYGCPNFPNCRETVG